MWVKVTVRGWGRSVEPCYIFPLPQYRGSIKDQGLMGNGLEIIWYICTNVFFVRKTRPESRPLSCFRTWQSPVLPGIWSIWHLKCVRWTENWPEHYRSQCSRTTVLCNYYINTYSRVITICIFFSPFNISLNYGTYNWDSVFCETGTALLITVQINFTFETFVKDYFFPVYRD